MLKRSLAVLLLVFSPRAAAGAGEPAAVDDATRAAIRGVIESQLAAFQRDDGTEAFSYAAPGIRRKFGNEKIFMDMVRTGYAPVYRPREVEFRELLQKGTTLQQQVLFVGPDGQPVLALYTMEQQADGSWLISGVILLRTPEATT